MAASLLRFAAPASWRLSECKAASGLLSMLPASSWGVAARAMATSPAPGSDSALPSTSGRQQEARQIIYEQSYKNSKVVRQPDWFMTLANLRPNPGSIKPRIRPGRGWAAHRGHTAGRGSSGQKKHENIYPLFDGGTTTLLKAPIQRIKPPLAAVYSQVSLWAIVEWIMKGKLDPGKVITMKDLRDSGCCGVHVKYGVNVYGHGPPQLKWPLHLEVTSVEPEAKAAVERAGGRVTRVYYTRDGLQAMLMSDYLRQHGLPLPLPAALWHPRFDALFDKCGDIIPDRTIKGLPEAAAAAAAGSSVASAQHSSSSSSVAGSAGSTTVTASGFASASRQ